MATTKVKAKSTIDYIQRALLDQLTRMFSGEGQGLFGQTGGGIGPTDFSYGQNPANFQSLSLAGLENIALGDVGGTGTLRQGDEALKGIINRGPTNLSDYVQSNIVDPTTQDFNRSILPGIRSTGTGQGVRFSQGGAARERLAGADATERIARARSSAMLQGRQMDDQTLMNAIASAGGIRSGMTQNLIAGRSSVLQPEQLTEQSRQNAIKNALTMALGPSYSLGGSSNPNALDWLGTIIGGISAII